MFSDISQRVRKRRNHLHLTIEELAEDARVSVSLISKIERGQVENVSLKKLQGIADALDMDISEFFIDNQSLDEDTITLIHKMKKLPTKKRQEAAEIFLSVLRY